MSEVKFYCGECSQVMERLPEESIDMVLTSPPYGTIRQYKGFTFEVVPIIEAIMRVLKPGGVCVWVTADQMVKGSESGESFKTALAFMEHGFLLHDTMIYRKQNPMPNITNDKVRYHQSFEYMFCFSNGKPKTFNPIIKECIQAGNLKSKTGHRNNGLDAIQRRPDYIVKSDKVAGNVFSYVVGNGCTTAYKPAFKHPAIYPEALARDQILSWTNIGDTVLDPMCGSGTTVFCAHALSRNAIGIDISDEYIDLAKRRIKEQKRPVWGVNDG